MKPMRVSFLDSEDPVHSVARLKTPHQKADPPQAIEQIAEPLKRMPLFDHQVRDDENHREIRKAQKEIHKTLRNQLTIEVLIDDCRLAFDVVSGINPERDETQEEQSPRTLTFQLSDNF